MRFTIFLLIASAACAQDANEIIRRATDRDFTNFESRKNYTYQERTEFRQYDGKGKLTKTEIETREVLILATETIPEVPEARRLEVKSLGDGIYRVIASYGFMQEPNVPEVLGEAAKLLGLPVDSEQTTYYLGRESVRGGQKGAMGAFAESLFSYLQRNAVTADQHFHIPPRQVIEIGLQLDL